MYRLRIAVRSLICLFIFFACTKTPPTLNDRLEAAITAHEVSVNQQVTIDSVVIMHVDSLTELGYAKLMLEQLENMQYDYEAVYLSAAGGTDEELTSLELQLQEIQEMCDHYRQIVQDFAADDDAFFAYFVSANVYGNGTSQLFMYVVNQDFAIMDDPFL